MKKTGFLLIAVGMAFATAISAFGQNVADVGIGADGQALISASEFAKQLMLVNKKNLLPEEYVPELLVDIAKSVSATKSEIFLQQPAAENYIKMIEAMKADGISLAAVSGYRTYQYQRTLYINKTNYYKKYYNDEEARIKAGTVVAPPGASEHQTGLAIDVSVSSIGYALDGRFQDTKAYKWLTDNSYKYGFIVRYPEDKQDITDIIFEPWHLRYVGAPFAEDIYTKGVCLEEYIENVN